MGVRLIQDAQLTVRNGRITGLTMRSATDLLERAQVREQLCPEATTGAWQVINHLLKAKASCAGCRLALNNGEDNMPIAPGFGTVTIFQDETENQYLVVSQRDETARVRPGVLCGRHGVWDQPTTVERIMRAEFDEILVTREGRLGSADFGPGFTIEWNTDRTTRGHADAVGITGYVAFNYEVDFLAHRHAMPVLVEEERFHAILSVEPDAAAAQITIPLIAYVEGEIRDYMFTDTERGFTSSYGGQQSPERRVWAINCQTGEAVLFHEGRQTEVADPRSMIRAPYSNEALSAFVDGLPFDAPGLSWLIHKK